ncbi:retinoblastoma-like protein 1 isoform X2 [Euwallacea similis]|uniref:retinoblastoma-like protein 1 isoform X2 n=1 Tax=Euwallacea similis TaxID=1736056 RepID=UPI00344F66ED
MVQSNSSNDELSLHQELCSKLNLDMGIVAASWETFESISKKFALEGEKIHWLGCAIYVASRNMETPTVDNSSVVKGMGINLTSLLRHSNLTFMQFFNNITRWADMAQLPPDFRTKIDNMRNNFSITYNTFKKLHPLFIEIFLPPIPNKQDVEAAKHRYKKSRTIPCTSLKIFEFIWNMFITLKAEESLCSTELIKAHHLLFCCIDYAFKNVVSAERKDLLNGTVTEELLQYNQDFRALKEVPCIVKRFCKCDTVIKEALHMKAYTFRQLLTKFIDQGILLADETDFTGVFERNNFDQNFKNFNKAYETHLLSRGDFDERIFLAEFKRVLLDKEQTVQSWTSMRVLPPSDSDGALLESPKAGTGTANPRILDTPLTGRRFLGPRDGDLSGRSVPERISRLQTIIGSRSADASEQLKSLFESCGRNILPKINDILDKMKKMFIAGYTANNLSKEEAQNKLDLGGALFFKYVEMILNKEKNITPDISGLVEKEVFYQCMFACCLEIVLYCYNFPKKFPWILDVLKVEPIHFVKVIELVVRSKDNLFRELIKHLNRIEETIIESLAWRSSSPIWDAIEKSGQEIPKFQDTALPGHLLYNEASNEHLLQSPGPPSAADRFQSPLSQLCKNLFPSSGSGLQRPGTHLVLPDKDGKVKFIPILDAHVKIENPQTSPGTKPDPQAAALPRRTGSLSIIFRKFYYLAGVRMQHLCSQLGFEEFELRRKIWTIFEDSIRHTDLIKDRHLDQLLMCAIYVICKAANVTNNPNLFSLIMKFYRQQPQASSCVYRDVLINRARTVDGEEIPEENDHLILFYNHVYIKVMQSYAVRFKPNANNTNYLFQKDIVLSPLPASRKNLISSSNQQVVGNVFIKPMDTSTIPVNNGSSFNYYFSRSPSKDLMNINRAINGNGIQGKRLLIDEDGNVPATKRLAPNRKLQSLVEDRQRQNSASND